MTETQSSSNEAWNPANATLFLVQAGESRYHPLFFVHGVAGNVERFRNLVRRLGPEETIYVLQDQGLEGEGPILTRVEAMASGYIGEMKKVQPEGPYFVAGYSFGGLVAFEIAQQLERQRDDVPLVALIDAGQPIYRKDYAHVLFSPKVLGSYVKRIMELLSDPESRRTLASRIRNELWRLFFLRIGGRLRKTESKPQRRTQAMLDAAKLEAAMNYNPTAFAGRLSVFRVEERITVDKYDRYLGWGGLADKGIDVYDVPGDHVTACEEPHVAVLAEKFKLALQASRTKIAPEL